MKGAFVILSLLFMLLVLPQQQRTEAKSWVRKVVRTVRRVVKPVVCSLACHTACNTSCSGTCVLVCTPVCSKVCNGKKKRGFGGASFDEEVGILNI